MIRAPLHIGFKGPRTYVHGTDMLDGALRALRIEVGTEPLTRLRFRVHKMTARNLVLSIDSSEEVESPGPAVATLAFHLGERPWHGQLLEGPGDPTERHPYDEAQLIRRCELIRANRTIRLAESSPFSFIETVVAMNKALHLAVWPDVPAPWVFCRWDSDCTVERPVPRDLQVALVHTLGTRLTRAEVSAGGARVGDVFFSANAGR